jgi:hypothetical protein
MGLAIKPQAGVALGMAPVAGNSFPELGDTVLPLVIGLTPPPPHTARPDGVLHGGGLSPSRAWRMAKKRAWTGPAAKRRTAIVLHKPARCNTVASHPLRDRNREDHAAG